MHIAAPSYEIVMECDVRHRLFAVGTGLGTVRPQGLPHTMLAVAMDVLCTCGPPLQVFPRRTQKAVVLHREPSVIRQETQENGLQY